MNKFAFSALGTQQLLEQLYMGDPHILQQEAQDAENDLTSWLQKWFELDTVQKQYLRHIPAAVIGLLASEISHCLSRRLAISLNKPLPPQSQFGGSRSGSEEKDCDRTGKILIWERETGGSYTPGGGYGEDSHLDISLLCPEEPE